MAHRESVGAWGVNLPPSQGGPYSPEGENGKDGKGRLRTLQETRKGLRGDLNRAEEKGEADRHDPHAEHLADQTHRGYGPGGHPVHRPIDGTHDGIGVGG